MPLATRPHLTVRPDALVSEGSFKVETGDFAASVDVDRTYYLTKGSAAAVTVKAPGAKNIGRRLTFITGSDFAHVVTFTGSTLKDGTTGAKITWTSVAFIGSSITVRASTATQWVVESKNLGTVA